MESVSREKLTADFGEAFLTLQHTYNICMQLLLGKYGLYPGQPQVLFALSKLGAPTQNELAAHLGIGKYPYAVSKPAASSSASGTKRTRAAYASPSPKRGKTMHDGAA